MATPNVVSQGCLTGYEAHNPTSQPPPSKQCHTDTIKTRFLSFVLHPTIKGPIQVFHRLWQLGARER